MTPGRKRTLRCYSAARTYAQTHWVYCQTNKIYEIHISVFLFIHPTSKSDTLRLDFSTMFKQMPAASNHIDIDQRFCTSKRCILNNNNNGSRSNDQHDWMSRKKAKQEKPKSDSTQQKAVQCTALASYVSECLCVCVCL